VLDIFQEAGLPLWLRPYEVLVTSSYTALIETIPDTVMIYTELFRCTSNKVSAHLFSCFVVSCNQSSYIESVCDKCTIYPSCRLLFILSKVDIPT